MVFALATNNQKKLKEIQRILKDTHHTVKTLKELNIDIDIVEDGKTFSENAIIKSKTISQLTNLACISDDSGLSVEYLNGAPGVFTARYAKENATDDENIEFLLKNLKDVKKENRKAKFISAVCLYFPSGEYEVFIGECEGYIATEKKGDKGFGYDPIFTVGERSFAQLEDEEKDAISHRGIALEKLKEKLKDIKE